MNSTSTVQYPNLPDGTQNPKYVDLCDEDPPTILSKKYFLKNTFFNLLIFHQKVDHSLYFVFRCKEIFALNYYWK